jgi:hypothetical protein
MPSLLTLNKVFHAVTTMLQSFNLTVLTILDEKTTTYIDKTVTTAVMQYK